MKLVSVVLSGGAGTRLWPAVWLGAQLGGMTGVFIGVLCGNVAAGVASWFIYRHATRHLASGSAP